MDFASYNRLDDPGYSALARGGMKRLHIGQFTNTYKPVLSGVVRSVSSFRQALSDMGHNVFIFAQSPSGKYEEEEPFVFHYPAMEIPAYKYPMNIPVSRTIDNVFPSLKLDVVHAHHPAGIGKVGANKAKEYGLPLVFTHHTRYREYAEYVSLVPKNISEMVIGNWLIDFMSNCHHVIVPSETIKASLTDSYGITDRVTVMPTGIDLTPYRKADGTAVRAKHGWKKDQRIILSMGRLANVKNWPLLIDAAQIVLAKHPDVRFALIGDGPERDSLEKQVKKLAIADRFEFVGRIPYEDVPSYLKAGDLFVYASTTETQGLVTLEALAAGLPVVAVDASGTNETVEDGVDGLLTANDHQALAEAIDRVLSDETLYHELQLAAKAKAESWDIKVLSQKLLDIYAQATEDQKAGRTMKMDRKKTVFDIHWRDFFQTAEE